MSQGIPSNPATPGTAPADKARIVAGVRERVWPLVDAGAIRPIIDRTVPMRDAAEAHRLMESSEHVGKIILLP